MQCECLEVQVSLLEKGTRVQVSQHWYTYVTFWSGSPQLTARCSRPKFIQQVFAIHLTYVKNAPMNTQHVNAKSERLQGMVLSLR